jgi:hypothetical protein
MTQKTDFTDPSLLPSLRARANVKESLSVKKKLGSQCQESFLQVIVVIVGVEKR